MRYEGFHFDQLHDGAGQRFIIVARQLEVESRLREMGTERISIRVFHGEAGAVEFWRSVGYDAEPTESIYVKNL